MDGSEMIKFDLINVLLCYDMLIKINKEYND